MTNLGFTLIELLVVITIIAILAALLFPVLSRAKAQVQSVRCQSNLRQMGIALQMYVGDFKAYPYFRTDSPPNEPKNYGPWQSKLRLYYPLEWTNRAYHCPAYIGLVEPLSNAEPIFGSYGYNAAGLSQFTSITGVLGLGLYSNFDPAVPEARVVAPSEMYAMMDSVGYITSTNDGATLMWSGIDKASPQRDWIRKPPQHGKSFNVVHCDGHVAAIPITWLFNPTNSAQNWNNDHQPHPEAWP